MKNQKITTYQMAVTAVMAAVLCVLGPLTVPIGAIPISLANFVICLTAWLLGPKFGTLSVVIYLAIGLIGVPVFSGYGAGLAKVAGPTGGYLVGYLLLAFIGGLFIEKSNGQPVVSAVGLVLGDAACYVLGTAWFVFQMQCELGYALAVCVYPFIVLDLAKIVVSCVVGTLSSFFASSRASSFAQPFGITMVPRTLPLTWTPISMESSTVLLSSYSGHLERESKPSPPMVSQISSQR